MLWAARNIMFSICPSVCACMRTYVLDRAEAFFNVDFCNVLPFAVDSCYAFTAFPVKGVARIFEWGTRASRAETQKASSGVGLGGGVPVPMGVGSGEGAVVPPYQLFVGSGRILKPVLGIRGGRVPQSIRGYATVSGRGTKYCDQRVCLSVCLPACVSQTSRVQTSRNFLRMLTEAAVCSSSDGSAVCFVFPGLWMTLCLHKMARRVGDGNRLYAQRDSPRRKRQAQIVSLICRRVRGRLRSSTSSLLDIRPLLLTTEHLPQLHVPGFGTVFLKMSRQPHLFVEN